MPVIVTLAVPVLAVALAVSVSVLVVVAGFVPNLAVTPVVIRRQITSHSLSLIHI